MSSQPTQAELIADQELAEISSRIALISSLTPTNLFSERKRFFNGEVEHPQFRYQADHDVLESLRKQLDKIKIPETRLGALFEGTLEDLRGRLDLIAAIGTDAVAFTKFSLELFGAASPKTLADARSILAEYGAQGKSTAHKLHLSSKAVVQAFRDVLAHYQLDSWQVEEHEGMLAGAVVDNANRRIKIAANSSLSTTRLAPFITHEIETHVLTSENGSRQPLRLFRSGMRNYLRTQEGLAAYNMTTQFPDNPRPLRFWARNALAADFTLRLPFRKVYEKVIELGFDERYAFGVTTKVKRGLSDTSQPGGLTKDQIYLAGRQDIIDFVAAGGAIKDLYIGKVAVADVPLLLTFDWIKKPTHLPDFLK